jgi:hypothetical protein
MKQRLDSGAKQRISILIFSNRATHAKHALIVPQLILFYKRSIRTLVDMYLDCVKLGWDS